MNLQIQSTVKALFCLYIGIIVLLQPFNEVTAIERTYSSKNNVNDSPKELEKKAEVKSIDELLGPEDNFPFLPDNHRDGSNPIGRIGKINNIP
tara:strand:- start:550 stop:828 length:279 start_codon:yes stop_codon:yes gene_type:complete